MNTKELGDLGERTACEYLVKRGYKILAKNYRISFGEIDIIAKKKWRLWGNDKTIHFVEVKTIIDNNRGVFPEEHVDARKQRKLNQLSQIWLQKHNYPQDFPYQIDVVGILVEKNGEETKLNYFPNAISEL